MLQYIRFFQIFNNTNTFILFIFSTINSIDGTLEDGTLEECINQEGIDFYNNLINELFDNGMN